MDTHLRIFGALFAGKSNLYHLEHPPMFVDDVPVSLPVSVGDLPAGHVWLPMVLIANIPLVFHFPVLFHAYVLQHYTISPVKIYIWRFPWNRGSPSHHPFRTEGFDFPYSKASHASLGYPHSPGPPGNDAWKRPMGSSFPEPMNASWRHGGFLLILVARDRMSAQGKNDTKCSCRIGVGFWIFVLIYIYIYVCMYVCIYIYIPTYIHNYDINIRIFVCLLQ